MKDGRYTRTWTTSAGEKTAHYIVRNGRAMALKKPGEYRNVEWWMSLDGSWEWQGPLDVGQRSPGEAL